MTLDADDRVLERARELARRRPTTPNGMFRTWLTELTAEPMRRSRYEELVRRLEHAHSCGRLR